MPDYELIIHRYVCWATGPSGARVPTVLRARTAADAIVQAELLLRSKPWALSAVMPFEETLHSGAKLMFSREPWGRGDA